MDNFCGRGARNGEYNQNKNLNPNYQRGSHTGPRRGHSGAVSKSQTVNYYYRLESESSMQSEDTESVTSLQGRETEYVQDSEDTDSNEYFEYEVASLSEADGAPTGASSSYGTDDDIFVTEEVIAAVLGDTSLEAWAADGGEDSCSSTESEDFGKTDFRICAQCKSKNNNPRFLFCEKCYQVRKSFYPPPPKRSKKRNNESNKGTVNVDNLRTCLSGLSQDSVVGSSSQEFLSLDFKDIKVPKHHLDKCDAASASGMSSASSTGSSSFTKTSEVNDTQTTSRKRKASDSVSDNEVRRKKIVIEGPFDIKNENTETLTDRLEKKPESKELCITCTVAKIDGIFAHGSNAHASCCYRCAIKIWKSTKRCPVCNRRVSSVFRLYGS